MKKFLNGANRGVRIAFVGFVVALIGVAVGFFSFYVGERWLSLGSFAVTVGGVFIGFVGVVYGWLCDAK